MLVAGEHRIELDGGNVRLRLVFGDATETLPVLDGAVDAFYLDGFSPAKNPDLWSPLICRNLARLARPGATLATWSVAGCVRRTLGMTGFVVEKCPGFAGKRQMLAGRYISPSQVG
jgi:tRNA 5-methylaminomethyl-2-thiouridine biosynthesis bifunctional protein